MKDTWQKQWPWDYPLEWLKQLRPRKACAKLRRGEAGEIQEGLLASRHWRDMKGLGLERELRAGTVSEGRAGIHPGVYVCVCVLCVFRNLRSVPL